jgi:hypothetical protein
LLHAIHSVCQPNKIVLGTEGPVDAFTKSLPASETPMMYLCSGNACQRLASEMLMESDFKSF